MILEVAAATGSVWALRRMTHHAILRGLRAPRLVHAQGPGAHGFAADQVREVRIPGPPRQAPVRLAGVATGHSTAARAGCSRDAWLGRQCRDDVAGGTAIARRRIRGAAHRRTVPRAQR